VNLFGKILDGQILATIHVSLAAGLPGLISRLGKKLTSNGYHLTLKYLDLFERRIAVNNFDDATFGNPYREFEFHTRELFADVIAVYTQSGLGKN
jgi:hypothetical protein